MSDQNPGGADFRGSAADKRKDETVMVSAEDLSNLVADARQTPPPAEPVAPAPTPPVYAPTASTNNNTLLIVLGVLIVLVVLGGAAFLLL